MCGALFALRVHCVLRRGKDVLSSIHQCATRERQDHRMASLRGHCMERAYSAKAKAKV
jgi:hypothetical protein